MGWDSHYVNYHSDFDCSQVLGDTCTNDQNTLSHFHFANITPLLYELNVRVVFILPYSVVKLMFCYCCCISLSHSFRLFPAIREWVSTNPSQLPSSSLMHRYSEWYESQKMYFLSASCTSPQCASCGCTASALLGLLSVDKLLSLTLSNFSPCVATEH